MELADRLLTFKLSFVLLILFICYQPHQCSICDPPRGFHILKSYREHMNIHTNERPYKCHVCNAGFNCESNMFAHIKTTHKGIRRKK